MIKKIKWGSIVTLGVALIVSLSLFGCKPVEPVAKEPEPEAVEEPVVEGEVEEEAEVLKIGYFVSTLANVFHQARATVAVDYAMEEYGAKVYIFDGKSDSTVMTGNIDQLVAQGMNMATLQIWDPEAGKPGILDAIDAGVAINMFFSPLVVGGVDVGIPTVRHDEPGASFDMGAEMAKQWIAANPDKPIVMVQLGWPDHVEVKSGRTDPFVKGVLSVAPDATNLGCLDASAGADAAKQIIIDLVTTNPEVNLIYSEASDLTVGTMAGLIQAGRGKTDDNGVPTTEIVCSVDFDEVEMKEIYDSNSSLKLSMGLPPKETSYTIIDALMATYNGEIAQFSTPHEVTWAPTFTASYYSVSRNVAVNWLNDQFGTSIK